MVASRDRENAFDALFAEHYEEVLAYVVRRAPVANAEDALAETFLVAWRRADQLPDDPLPWLYGVARRVLSNPRRGDRRRRALTARLISRSLDSGPRWEPPDGLSLELVEGLASLSEHEREAGLLVAWEGLDPARAAVAAGCTAAAFRVRLHRARRRLSGALGSSTSSPGASRARQET
jgi:RNA polymerase sigma-70 factor (ECF subfamily)